MLIADRYELIPFFSLSSEAIEQWRGLSSTTPRGSSPFLSYEFAEVLSDFFPNIQVAVAWHRQTIIGLLPLMLEAGGARPIGGELSQLQVVLRPTDSEVGLQEILRANGIVRWECTSLISMDAGIDKLLSKQCGWLAPLAEHPQGYAEYLQRERYTLRQQIRRTRKLVREHGELRFVGESNMAPLLEHLIRWKHEQKEVDRSNYPAAIASSGDTLSILRRLLKLRSQECRPLLSALYAGDQLVAVHFGLRSRKELHYWIPGYRSDFHQYSPGTELFLQVCTYATNQGIALIDLGAGDAPFKEKWGTKPYDLWRGSIAFDP